MSGFNGSFKILFLTLLISGCVTQGPDNLKSGEIVLPAKSQFWVPPEDRSACPSGSDWALELPIQSAARGWKRGNRAVLFIKINASNIASSLANEDFEISGYVREFVTAAKSRAYTTQDFEGPGGPSPVFTQSLLLISLSYTVSLFDYEKAWTESERQTVIAWGNRISAKQDVKRRYSTLDSLAAIAAARMSWGAATSQPDIFENGLSDFHGVAGHMNNNGQYETSLRDNNEDVQFMILAAEAATRSGIAAYEFSYGGLTLHDAIEWHTKKTLQHGGKKFSASTDPTPRSYFRRQGHVAHVAWIPIYLSRFPDRAASPGLRKILDTVDYSSEGLYGNSMGGPTECFWGRHR